MDLKGKNVLITGGTRGIGRAISFLFAKQGARLCINYRTNISEAQKIIKELPGEGHECIQADISLVTGVEILMEQCLQSFSSLDILINNAGIAFHHDPLKVDFQVWQESWQKTISTNLIGPANLCYKAAQVMKIQRSGSIINISSRGAFRGEPLMPAYGASKAGLNAMTQSLAYALAPYQVFVGAIAPGFVETDMAKPRLQGKEGEAIKHQSPLGRVAKPEEVAQACLLMAHSPIWMTGGIFDVNGASYFRS